MHALERQADVPGCEWRARYGVEACESWSCEDGRRQRRVLDHGPSCMFWSSAWHRGIRWRGVPLGEHDDRSREWFAGYGADDCLVACSRVRGTVLYVESAGYVRVLMPT